MHASVTPPTLPARQIAQVANYYCHLLNIELVGRNRLSILKEVNQAEAS